MKTASQHQAGFSIVELMIALIIVGLLIGGVLKSQELITNSKIKRIMQDFEGVSIAHYAYQDRVGAIAGDTDDNQLIDDEEQFWVQMRSEGFLTGSSTDGNASQHVFNGLLTVGSGVPFEGYNWVCASLMKTRYALSMEHYLDDGDGQTGLIRTSDQTAYPEDPDVLITLCKVL